MLRCVISVDKDSKLHGVCFFNSREGTTHSVDLEVVDAERKTVLMLKPEDFQANTIIQAEKCSYYGFQVLFNKKIISHKSISNGIRALISGSPSLQHEANCVSSIQCSDVTFTSSYGQCVLK